MILGTISAVDNTDGLQLIIDGEDTPTTKKYNYIASYVPAANDRVLIEEIGGSYVIVGKIISDVESSGVVRVAENAVSADSADYAYSAASAASATTAANATTAASCSGNAASATVSDRTKGFDSMVGSAYGMLVTRVDRSYNSTLGTYIVTDVSTSYNNNFVYK
jgi:hypothetical protein